MPTFASTRARPCFIEQCSYCPKSQDYYHGMLAAIERFTIAGTETRKILINIVRGNVL